MTQTTRISDLIIRKFWPVFNDREHTHKILTSGRAGTKSSEAAIEVVYKIVSEEDCSAVVIRKRHNKLRKTVYKEIKRAIGFLAVPLICAFPAADRPLREIQLLCYLD